MPKYTVDMSDEDRKFVEKFDEQVGMLAGMVHEMIKVNPTYVLSPVLRKSLHDKATEVEGMRMAVHNKLCVDNLPKYPLKPVENPFEYGASPLQPPQE
jgi:hypothetical protein